LGNLVKKVGVLKTKQFSPKLSSRGKGERKF